MRKITNEQMKQFQYINIHNGYWIDEINFNGVLDPNNNTQQIVWDCHCGPSEQRIERNPKSLLHITNIKTKQSIQKSGSHRCLNNIQLSLSTSIPPQRGRQCPDFRHHPLKLNELYVNNIPSEYNEYQVLNIFNQYSASIKFIRFNPSVDPTTKTAIIQTNSAYTASEIIKPMGKYACYSNKNQKHTLTIGYNRIETCGFTYRITDSFDKFISAYASQSGVDMSIVKNWNQYIIPYADFDAFLNDTKPRRRIQIRQTLNVKPIINSDMKYNRPNNTSATATNIVDYSMNDISNVIHNNSYNISPQNVSNTNYNCNDNNIVRSESRKRQLPSSNTYNHFSNPTKKSKTANNNQSNAANESIPLINTGSIKMPSFGNISTSPMFSVPFHYELMNANKRYKSKTIESKQYRAHVKNICFNYGETVKTGNSHIRRINQKKTYKHSFVVIPNFNRFRHLTPSQTTESIKNNTNYTLKSVKEIIPKFVTKYHYPFNAIEAHKYLWGVSGQQHYPKKSQDNTNIAKSTSNNSNQPNQILCYPFAATAPKSIAKTNSFPPKISMDICNKKHKRRTHKTKHGKNNKLKHNKKRKKRKHRREKELLSYKI
eukprot:422354_1